MSVSSAPYDIARTEHQRDETCAASGRPLEPGQIHIAALIEHTGESALQRVLYSLEAWERGVELPEGAELFGFWKRRAPEKDEDRGRGVLSDDELMDLFEQLEGTDRESQIVFRYLLALMLMRKKRLEIQRMRPAEGDAPPVLIMRRRGAGEDADPFEVVDPGMDDDDVAKGIEEIGRVLHQDTNRDLDQDTDA